MLMDYYKLKVLNNKKKIIIISIILVTIILICYFYIKENDNKDENIIIKDNTLIEKDNTESSLDNIYVDIKGLVNKPGVYSFKITDNARVNDLILKAGGLMKDADTSTINLSKKLDDEMTVIIYSKSEITNFVKTQDDTRKKLEICENKLKNNACIKEEKVTNNSKININEASLEELESLNGIGEAKAKAIIEYRNKSKFKNIEDIKNVEGIGESLFTSIKDSITV